MSFDYDRLRELADYSTPGPWRTDEHPYMDGQSVYNADGATLAQHLSGNNAELVTLAPDMAAELLRLRDGIEVIRDRCETLAESAQTTNISLLANLGYEMDINAKALTGLLSGDTP